MSAEKEKERINKYIDSRITKMETNVRIASSRRDHEGSEAYSLVVTELENLKDEINRPATIHPPRDISKDPTC